MGSEVYDDVEDEPDRPDDDAEDAMAPGGKHAANDPWTNTPSSSGIGGGASIDDV